MVNLFCFSCGFLSKITELNFNLIRRSKTLSGHSKWHNIQKTKGAQDAKRAKIFTKIAREIIVAVKVGGGDPANNSSLAAAVTKAKAANMPNDNIKRTIDKAAGSAEGSDYESITYEGYGPSGVAVIVETMTDNRNRTASEMRHYFDKYGGNIGVSGCVSWSFDRKGVIIVDKEDLDEDDILGIALEAGAEDFQAEGPVFEIYTDPIEFQAVVAQLEAANLQFLSAQLEMVPQNYIALTDEDDIKNMRKMLDMFEDNDDVQEVWHNWEE